MPRVFAKRVCVGAVTGAHGQQGEVRLRSFTDEPGDMAAYGPVETEDGRRSFVITIVRPVKNGFVAGLGGVSTRDQAEALKGEDLYVPRSRLPEAGEDEFYYADLMGLSVEEADGTVLGAVVAVEDFGAGYLIEVALVDAYREQAGNTTVYIPFTRDVVPELDLDGGKLIVDLPPGLIEAADTEKDTGQSE